MSEEQLKAFLEAVKADAGLQEKLRAAADANAVVAIAKAAGFVISVEELEAAVSARSGELSDEELERAVGGNCNTGSNGNTQHNFTPCSGYCNTESKFAQFAECSS